MLGSIPGLSCTTQRQAPSYPGRSVLYPRKHSNVVLVLVEVAFAVPSLRYPTHLIPYVFAQAHPRLEHNRHLTRSPLKKNALLRQASLSPNTRSRAAIEKAARSVRAQPSRSRFL